MPSLDIGVQQVTVRVAVRDVPGRGTITREVPASGFETGDRGLQIGALFVPWSRVVEYDWSVRQEVFDGDRARDAVKLRVRVVVDDGTPEGEIHDVAADRYEAGPFTVTLLIDRHVDAEAGELVVQRLFIPWHRVVSVERYTARPDLERGPHGAPSRPDVG